MRISRHSARAWSLAGLALLILVPACNPALPTGPHAVHPVEGQVLFDGKPVSGAQVSLLPVDESKFGESIPRPMAQTDDAGRFHLMTYSSGDGAPEGSYLVGIAGMARPQTESGNLLESTKDAGKTDMLKGRFLDPKTSGLKVTIKPGPNTLEPFQLNDSAGTAPPASPSSRSR